MVIYFVRSAGKIETTFRLDIVNPNLTFLPRLKNCAIAMELSALSLSITMYAANISSSK